MEYKSLAKLPATARRRLVRSAQISLGLATIVVPLIELATFDPSATWWWSLGVLVWLSAVVLLVICSAAGGRISRPIHFYALENLALWPGYLVMLGGGIRILQEGLGASFARAFLLGLVIGLVALPLGIAFRSRWMRQAIRDGHLSEALNTREATWDPRFDADHVVKDPRLKRSGCLLSLLFWVGPALGLALSDIVGQATAIVIAGLLFASLGYVGLLGSGTDLAILSLELEGMERRLNRQIVLEPQFTRGG